MMPNASLGTEAYREQPFLVSSCRDLLPSARIWVQPLPRRPYIVSQPLPVSKLQLTSTTLPRTNKWGDVLPQVFLWSHGFSRQVSLEWVGREIAVKRTPVSVATSWIVMCEIVLTLKITPITFSLQLGAPLSQQLVSQVILRNLYRAVKDATTLIIKCKLAVVLVNVYLAKVHNTSTAVRSTDQRHRID